MILFTNHNNRISFILNRLNHHMTSHYISRHISKIMNFHMISSRSASKHHISDENHHQPRVVISAGFQAAKKLPMPNLGTFTLGDESRLKLSNWSLGGDVKILGIPYVVHIPSGNLLHSYGTSPFIVDFPIEHGDFPQLCNSYVANYQRVESLWSQGMISMIYEFI